MMEQTAAAPTAGGSAVAGNLLKDWNKMAKQFVKVMPTDYKNALKALKEGKVATHRDSVFAFKHLGVMYAAREETRDLVNMAIAHLPENYRVVLARKYVDDEPLETLAGELGISVDATKSLLARARRAFRDTFAALGQALTEVAP